MRLLRTTLIILGVVIASALVFIGANSWVADPWDLPPDSARYLAYDYLLVKHRWVTAAFIVLYGVLLAASFKREFVQSLKIEGGREFWIRLLLCSVILLSLGLLWSA